MQGNNYDILNMEMMDAMRGMSSFVSSNQKLGLPNPTNEFLALQQLLDKPDLNVVVCGKVKNGKSSLINAFIGRSLLPVCSDVATSQVFKLSHSLEDCFRVIFSNGNKLPINFEQLSKFGSQRESDMNGIKDAGQTIEFIEVGTKMDFLPDGVSLIDSPGIGSTYPQHTAITKKCVRMADAVLFVMNPSPLEKLEIDFLKELVKITPNIMFVMTKAEDIDSVKENILKNTKLINDAIGDDLYREIRILPISSTTLMEAGGDSDKESSEFNIEVSGYNEVKKELLDLVSLAKGYYRVGEAFNYSLKYYKLVLEHLRNRLSIAEAEGKKNKDIQNQISSAKRRLVDFGKTKQKKIIEDVDLRLSAFSQSFAQKTRYNGPIVTKFVNEIDNLTADKLQEYTDSLPTNIITYLQNEWEQLQRALEKEITGILSEYSSLIQAGPTGEISLVPMNPNTIVDLETVGFRKRALNARNEAMIGIGGVTIMSFLGATSIPVVGPVIVLSALGYTLYGLFAGNTRAKAEVLKSNKSKLKQFVQDTVRDFYNQYTEVSLEDGKYKSIIDGYKLALRSYAADSIDQIYRMYEQEVSALEEIQNGNKAESAVLLRGIIEKWSNMEQSLVDIRKQLEEINSSL